MEIGAAIFAPGSREALLILSTELAKPTIIAFLASKTFAYRGPTVLVTSVTPPKQHETQVALVIMHMIQLDVAIAKQQLGLLDSGLAGKRLGLAYNRQSRNLAISVFTEPRGNESKSNEPLLFADDARGSFFLRPIICFNHLT